MIFGKYFSLSKTINYLYLNFLKIIFLSLICGQSYNRYLLLSFCICIHLCLWYLKIFVVDRYFLLWISYLMVSYKSMNMINYKTGNFLYSKCKSNESANL